MQPLHYYRGHGLTLNHRSTTPGLTPLLGEVLNHPVVERFNTGLSFNTGLTLVEHLCLSEVFNHPKRRFFAAAGATRMEGASRGSLPEEEAQQP